MNYKKLSADCEEELFSKVQRAAELDKRTLSNFIRLACEKEAEAIIQGGKNADITGSSDPAT